MKPSLYEPLLKSISVLAVDDEHFQREMYVKTIGDHRLYKVAAVSSACEAEQFLQSSGQISMCLLDLGIDDISNDEFYLLKKYGGQIPFIIISAAKDLCRGFQARDLGCVHLLPKPVNFFDYEFWNVLMKSFLDRTVLPSLPENASPVLVETCRTIRQESPETVAQWAALSGITESYLRRIWNESNLGPPKHTLFLYNFYKEALTYCNAFFLSEANDTVFPRNPDREGHRRKVRYFEQYRYELEALTNNNAAGRPVTEHIDLIVADIQVSESRSVLTKK